MISQNILPQQSSTLPDILKQIFQLIEQEQQEKCLQLIDKNIIINNQQQQQSHTFTQNNKNQQIQLLSLKGYILTMTKKYQQALSMLNTCLGINQYHLASRKRKAIVLQKLGLKEQCIKEFQFCLRIEPESKSIRNKIKRLTMNSAKSQSASSEGYNTLDQKPTKVKPKLTKIENQQQKQKQKQKRVKFGTFQVMEITGTEDSDQRQAIIKQEINKLSDKKPKKSILKDSMSGSVFKQKPKQASSPDSEKVEQTQKVENEQQKQKSEKLIKQANIQLEKQTLKKKAKSVTFKGDTSLQDFN